MVQPTIDSLLHKIEAPQLTSSEYGKNIREQFENIDDNFRRVSNKDFLEGKSGSSVYCEDRELYDGTNFTDLGKTMLDTITGLNGIDWNNLSPTFWDEHLSIAPVRNNTLCVYDYLKTNPKISVSYVLKDVEGIVDEENKIFISSPQVYTFLDQRFVSNFSENADEYEARTDMSCILTLKYEEDEPIFERSNLFPTLYYDNGEFKWKIYGHETGLRAMGPQGIPGQSASVYITKADDIRDGDINVTRNIQIREYAGWNGQVYNWFEITSSAGPQEGDTAFVYVNYTQPVPGSSENTVIYSDVFVSKVSIFDDGGGNVGHFVNIGPNNSVTKLFELTTLKNQLNNVQFGNALEGLFLPFNNSQKNANGGHVAYSDFVSETDDYNNTLVVRPISNRNDYLGGVTGKMKNAPIPTSEIGSLKKSSLDLRYDKIFLTGTRADSSGKCLGVDLEFVNQFGNYPSKWIRTSENYNDSHNSESSLRIGVGPTNSNVSHSSVYLLTGGTDTSWGSAKAGVRVGTTGTVGTVITKPVLVIEGVSGSLTQDGNSIRTNKAQLVLGYNKNALGSKNVMIDGDLIADNIGVTGLNVYGNGTVSGELTVNGKLTAQNDVQIGKNIYQNGSLFCQQTVVGSTSIRATQFEYSHVTGTTNSYILARVCADPNQYYQINSSSNSRGSFLDLVAGEDYYNTNASNFAGIRIQNKGVTGATGTRIVKVKPELQVEGPARATVNSVADVYLGCPIGTIVMYAGSEEPVNWLICDGRTLATTTYSKLYSVISNKYNSPSTASGYFNLPDLRQRFPIGVSQESSMYELIKRVYNKYSDWMSGTTIDSYIDSNGTFKNLGNTTTELRYSQINLISRVSDEYHLILSTITSYNELLGQVNSPEFRSKIYGITGNVGKSGGEVSHTLTISELAKHRHNMNYVDPADENRMDYNGRTSQKEGFDLKNFSSESLKNVSKYYKDTEKSSGEYLITAEGNSKSHNNMPPYLTINFIIKYA